MTQGPPIGTPDDPEGLLGVLARLAGEGNPWAVEVEAWRQDNPGRALTEGHRKVLRRERGRASAPRARLSAADEADVQAIVEAYVRGHRRIIADKGHVALESYYRDAKAILPDARRLAERAKRGEWKPTPADVVAHRLESYMRDARNKPTFPLRFIFDRTEQDDLPMPATRVSTETRVAVEPIGSRRGPVLMPTPPPADVAEKVAKIIEITDRSKSR